MNFDNNSLPSADLPYGVQKALSGLTPRLSRRRTKTVATAGGLGESSSAFFEVWRVLRSGARNRCEICPWLQTMHQMAERQGALAGYRLADEIETYLKCAGVVPL